MDFADRLDMMDDDCDIEGFSNFEENKDNGFWGRACARAHKKIKKLESELEQYRQQETLDKYYIVRCPVCGLAIKKCSPLELVQYLSYTRTCYGCEAELTYMTIEVKGNGN